MFILRVLRSRYVLLETNKIEAILPCINRQHYHLLRLGIAVSTHGIVWGNYCFNLILGWKIIRDEFERLEVTFRKKLKFN